MKIMIGTPAYGGQIFARYVNSLVRSIPILAAHKIEIAVMTLENESLITRGRNAVAYEAMQRSDIDKLLFIDADVSWLATDILRIVQSDKLIIGGTYPLKALPISMNFNPKDVDSSFFDVHKKTPELVAEFGVKHGIDGVVEVRHVPTGFMCIDTSVFHYLKTKVRSYKTWNDDKTGQIDIPDFFQTDVKPGGSYESEDWFFCSLATENGIPVYLDTKVMVNHTGTYTFQVKEI